ncbi:MAG: ATP synthase subunit I [Deltaproteobacteria bacterium]|nr:ATP synthase subunit I [Deltaproteobacteria bacterium]
MDWKALYRDLKVFNWVIFSLLAFISFFLMSHTFTAGIIVGGLMVIANFHVFQHTIRQGILSDDKEKVKKAPVIAKYYVRLLAMGVLIYYFVAQKWVDPVGFALGLSIVVISIAALGINMIRKTFSGETT